jgi:hypothetical protein
MKKINKFKRPSRLMLYDYVKNNSKFSQEDLIIKAHLHPN